MISTTGFSEALKWSVTAIAGLGAYDSVTGASQMTQLLPTPGSLAVNAVAGDPLNFVFQTTGTPHIPALHTTTALPPGLRRTGLVDSTVDSITGTPAQAGTFPVIITAWETAGPSGEPSGDSFSQAFTFEIVNPPLPEVMQSPASGNFAAGTLVKISAGHNHGRTFTWTRNGEGLPQQEKVFFSRSAGRKFRTAPASDPGAAWRSGGPFVESTDPNSQTDPAWTTVFGGIGYDVSTTTGGDFTPFIVPSTGNLQSLMFGPPNPPKPVAVHLRMPFKISTAETLGFLTLRVQCDDGFVAWLNGTEIASLNKPATLAWNSAASADILNSSPVNFQEIDVSQFLGLLRQGDNLLAVQAMNRATNSPDFLFNCELAGGINATNSPHLVLTDFQPAVAGTYGLTVANPAGSVAAQPATLLVLPAIQSQPGAVTIESGATAQLSVTAEGSPPFSYQWYSGASGDTSNPVAGATLQSFTTPSLTGTIDYWVRVTTPAGAVDSNAATVTVNAPVPDTYAEWKAARFSSEERRDPEISGPAADPDGDGFTNEQEYIFGTLPLLQESASPPDISVDGNQIEVSFIAMKATGPGYTGRVRHYAVETTGDVAAGPWSSLPEAADVTGNDQTVRVALTGSAGRNYCRLKVWLTP